METGSQVWSRFLKDLIDRLKNLDFYSRMIRNNSCFLVGNDISNSVLGDIALVGVWKLYE